MSNRKNAYWSGYASSCRFGRRLGRLLRPFWRGRQWLRAWDNGFAQGVYACWWCGR